MPEESLPRLDIWYNCDLSLCNFDCAYCSSGSPETGGPRTRKQMWHGEDGPDRLHRILRWIAGLPFSVGLRLQTIGEPFVSQDFLMAASGMTTESNIRFVELVTNGSLLTVRLGKMIDEFGADPARLTLWITFHHTEISIERLIENALYARQLGANVIVNTLLFPDSIESIARLCELCASYDLATNVDLGHNFNGAYEGLAFIPVAETETSPTSNLIVHNRSMTLLGLVAAVSPKGLNCSAGHDYIFIGPNGGVYPCLGYVRYLPNAKLGSALDPNFVLPLRRAMYAPCGIDKGCTCKEDFLHLEAAQPGPLRDRSLGYWPAEPPDAPARPIDRVLLDRLEQAGHSGTLADAPFWSRHRRRQAMPQ